MDYNSIDQKIHAGLSETSTVAIINLVASVGAVLSVCMWLADIRQIASFTSVAPAAALCCGLFGAVFSIWIAIRDSRIRFLGFAVWAIVPLVWTVCYLLVLHPRSL